MAQLLQHQEPAFYGKELNGCRWGILQFFGFRRRLRSAKMLSDKKHGQGKRNGGSRRRSSYTPLKSEDSGIIMDEEINEVTKKQKSSRKNSSKSNLRSLILGKLYGKEGQKEKMLPVAPKLLRTLSIHYLESDEYVIDGSSHGSTMSMQDATKKDLQHATSDTVGDSDNNISSLLSIKRDNSHVKRKSHRSISMDGVLHKVPYGKKVSDEAISDVLPRSASATYDRDRDGQKSYIGISAKRHANQAFRRSRSLTESLESYSRLLDSIANSESKRTLTSSKSTRDRSSDGPNMMSSLSRKFNAEFRSQGLTRLDETPEDALESHEDDAEKDNYHEDMEVGLSDRSSDEITNGSQNLCAPEECISDKKCDVAISIEVHSCTDPSPIEVDSCGARSTPEEVGTLVQHSSISDDDDTLSSKEADSYIPSSEDATIAEEEHTTHSDDSQMQSFQNSEQIEGTFCVPDPGQEFEADISLNYEQEETESPMSVLDLAFLDDPASPVKRTMLDDTLLKPKLLHLNDTDVVQENDSDDITGLHVDPSHEHEFTYVKELFTKSSFTTEPLYDEWYSQNITALQDDDCQHYEAAAAAFDFTTDMSAEQLLLFDLTNEALLDIHRKHSVCTKWRFSSFDRPKPVGRRVLEELWAEVSRRLDEQQRAGEGVEAVLASDMARSDRWVSFRRGAENLGNDLGDFVLDRVLTELVLELAEF